MPCYAGYGLTTVHSESRRRIVIPSACLAKWNKTFRQTSHFCASLVIAGQRLTHQRTFDARAGPIHSRTFMGTSGSYA
jgi:hypothetical protein